jgi:uncharacterized membrane protein YhaH (DUF805 family)
MNPEGRRDPAGRVTAREKPGDVVDGPRNTARPWMRSKSSSPIPSARPCAGRCPYEPSAGSTLLPAAYALVTLTPTIAVTVRRLHDIDHSAWFLLWMLILIVGGLVLLIHLCADTTQGQNQFGLSPKLVAAHL